MKIEINCRKLTQSDRETLAAYGDVFLESDTMGFPEYMERKRRHRYGA
jgi:hypothetical protein